MGIDLTHPAPIMDTDIGLFKHKFKALTAIVKPTYSCNLRCVYCYEAGRPKQVSRMSLSTLQMVLTRLVEFHGLNSEIHIIWHGGEPLLMGIDFYKKVIEYQKVFGNGYAFKNCIQTNGTLLNDEYIQFFSDNDFGIGLSLDGPEWIHDLVRPFANGKGSFSSVMNTIKKLQKVKINNQRILDGAIVVLSRIVANHLNEVYRFFCENNLNLKFCPLFFEGRASENELEIGISGKQYGDFLCDLFDLWFADTDSCINVDPFDLIIGNLLTQRPIGCQFEGSCFEHYIAFGPTGDTYPCGRWNGDDAFITGNITNMTIKDVLSSSTIRKIRAQRLLTTQKCINCKYISICNSGCLDQGYMIRKDIADKDYYCAGYYKLMEHIDLKLRAFFDEICFELNGCFATSDKVFVPYLGKYLAPSQIPHIGIGRALEKRIKESSGLSYSDYYHRYEDYNKYDKYSEYSKYSDYREYMEWRETGWRF